jgi:hypothetical protein
MPKKKSTKKKTENVEEPKEESTWTPEAPPEPPKAPKPSKPSIPVKEIMSVVSQKAGSDAIKQSAILEAELKERGISRDAWVKALLEWRRKR